MSNVVIVGAQWGDEGKGKIVDLFTSWADVVVRYAGGANAGHTLVVGGVKTVLRLVEPHFLPGALVVADLSAGDPDLQPYLKHVRDPNNGGYVSTWLPMDAGVELSVRTDAARVDFPRFRGHFDLEAGEVQIDSAGCCTSTLVPPDRVYAPYGLSLSHRPLASAGFDELHGLAHDAQIHQDPILLDLAPGDTQELESVVSHRVAADQLIAITEADDHPHVPGRPTDSHIVRDQGQAPEVAPHLLEPSDDRLASPALATERRVPLEFEDPVAGEGSGHALEIAAVLSCVAALDDAANDPGNHQHSPRDRLVSSGAGGMQTGFLPGPGDPEGGSGPSDRRLALKSGLAEDRLGRVHRNH